MTARMGITVECRKCFCHITLHIQVEVSLGYFYKVGVYVTMHTTHHADFHHKDLIGFGDPMNGRRCRHRQMSPSLAPSGCSPQMFRATQSRYTEAHPAISRQPYRV